MSNKRIIIGIALLGVFVVVVFGIDVWRNRVQPAARFDFSDVTRPEQYRESPSKGAKNPKVVIFEYADFNCPHCVAFQSVVVQVLAKYPDEVALVWKDFPFVSQGSEDAAVAARCAGKQGKFWEYHDWLFANQENVSSGSFGPGARLLGLDEKNFTQCLLDDTIRTVVSRDFAEGQALGVTQTPTLVIGDVGLAGVQTFEEVERTLGPILKNGK